MTFSIVLPSLENKHREPMWQPGKTQGGAPQVFAHTGLVRGGSLMLQPTDRAARLRIPAYPARERWFPDAPAYGPRPAPSHSCIPTS